MRNLSDLFTGQQSSLMADMFMFLPELILCAGIVLMLLLRMFRSRGRAQLGAIALIVVLCALGFTALQWNPEWFNGLLPPWLKEVLPKEIVEPFNFVPTPADSLSFQAQQMFGGLLV